MPFLRNLNLVHLKFFYPTMVRSSPVTLWHMCVRSSILDNILQSNRKMENFNKFLKASISKLCQEDTAAWDQVLYQILFVYRYCPHTSTGETPYTPQYNRDPPLPVQKLIKCIEPFSLQNATSPLNMTDNHDRDGL